MPRDRDAQVDAPVGAVEEPVVPTPETDREPAADEAQAAPDVEDSVVVEDPDVSVELNPAFELPEGEDSVFVSVPGLPADADYVDEDYRVKIGASPLTVPQSVANALTDSPAVRRVD